MRVYTLHVIQEDRFRKKLLVKRQSEPSIQVMTVEDRHTNNPSNEVEVRKMFLKEELTDHLKQIYTALNVFQGPLHLFIHSIISCHCNIVLTIL